VPHSASVTPFHVWGTLVEKAGYKRSDLPKTWDAFIDFFIPVQKKLQGWTSLPRTASFMRMSRRSRRR
jgi:hypothetical protein